MSAELRSLFPTNPSLKSVVRPEDLATEALARHLPWLSAPADDLILTRQGDLMASAVVEGQDSFTTEEGDLSLVTTSLARLVGQLGDAFGFHISKLTLPDAPSLKPFEGLDFGGSIDRCWQAHLCGRDLKRRVLLVTLILRPTALNRVPIFGHLFKAAFTEDMNARAERLNEAMGLVSGVCLGLGFRRLTISSGEWLGLLGVLIGQPMGRVMPMKGQFLATSLTRLQATFGGKHVELETGAGTRFGTIFGVKSYPARTWARMLDALELPFDIVISNSFTPARNNEIEERIKRTARQMRASEDAAETLRQELYEAADNVASGRQVFGKHHLTVMITAETPEKLEEAASEVWRAGQDCGATLLRESFAARAAWFAQAPGNWAYRPRTALISAQNFAHLAALHRVAEGRLRAQSPWGEVITVLPTVTSSLYRFNFHDKGRRGDEPSAGHTLVLGRTGSGKTLGTAFLMAQARRVGARILVIDKDRGLEMAVRALGGRYSAIRIGEATGLNPFQTEVDGRGAAWLTDWLGDILAGSRGFETTQTVSLNAAVRQIVGADARLRNFNGLGTLVASTDDEGDLVSRVREWGLGGRRGWLFGQGAAAEISLAEDVVGIDMSEILDLGAERSALLAYLFRRIERVIEDRRPTLIVIDEAWKMLDDPIFVKRLHDWLVTMRKKNAAVLMMTQTPTHLTQSKVGQIIAESVVTQLLYPNPRANPEDYRILRLNEKEAEFLCTPTGGLRLALLRSAGDSVFVNMDLSALGPLLAVLGGGRTGEDRAPFNWRDTPDFWKEMT
ncbi:MAG: type IV secretion system protein B4 [Gemmobacter sp.]